MTIDLLSKPVEAVEEFKIDYFDFDITDYSEISAQALRDTAKDTAGFQQVAKLLEEDTEQAKLEKFLTFWGTFARIGNQIYFNADGTIRIEHRPEEEVVKSLNSFRNKTISLDHPDGLILAENSRQHIRGITHEDVVYDRGLARIRITLTDLEAIKAIQETHKQLSAGYLAKVLEKKGDWFGDPYTHVQNDIYGNHIALVPRGRAGRLAISHLNKIPAIADSNNREIPWSIQILGDSQTLTKNLHFNPDDTPQYKENENNNNNIGDNILTGQKPQEEKSAGTTINIDGIDISVSESAAIAFRHKLNADAAKIVSLESEKDNLKSKLDSANGTINAQQAEIDRLKEENSIKDKQIKDGSDPQKIRELINRRKNLEKTAENFLSSNELNNLDSMSEREIMESTIKKIYGDKFSISGDDSDEYISGAFRVAIASNPKKKADVSTQAIVAAQNSHHTSNTAPSSNNDNFNEDDIDDFEAMRQRQMKKYADAAEAPLGATYNRR